LLNKKVLQDLLNNNKPPTEFFCCNYSKYVVVGVLCRNVQLLTYGQTYTSLQIFCRY